MNAHLIIAGDSNALGYLNNGPAPYSPTSHVQIWTGSAWNYMNPGVNTGTPNNPLAWGAEVQLANEWLQTHTAPTDYLWIVKDAGTVKGSTTLAGDWNPNTGLMFASTAKTASEAMHNLDGAAFAFRHYDAALVVLGENDAVRPEMAAAYHDNLVAFDFAARSAWHVDQLFETRISDTVGAPADNLAVRQAQWTADQADDHMTSFKTIGYGMQPDGIHYDASGFLRMGHDLYAGWFGA